MVRWEIVILLIMLTYPLAQTAEVHGASNAKTVDGITFAISADTEVYKGELLNVTLWVNSSSTGAWKNFYGDLYYNETLFNGVIVAPYVDHGNWTETYSISGLDVGCYNLNFTAWYMPYGGEEYVGPVSVSVLAYVVLPPTQKPTFSLTWLTPLSSHKSFEAGSKIPVRFSVHDVKTGEFICDKSVKVVVMNAAGEVFSAEYGTHWDDVRIRESAEYYIVDWKTHRTSGLYTILVEFQGILVDSRQIELR